MSGERTEKASPQKKRKAAEGGDRLTSRELNAAAGMLSGVVALHAVGGLWAASWRESWRGSLLLGLRHPERIVGAEQLLAIIRPSVAHAMRPLLVFALACFAGALSMGLIQTRGTVTFAAISPKWSRFSPASNIGQVFGMHSLVRLAKSLIPTTVVALLAVGKLSSESIYPSSSFHALRVLFNHVYDLLLDTAIATALWSAVDFLNNWRSREDRLKMSKQDVKDETKQSEGSPQIKRRIRQLQRQSRKRKLRADVRKATVVLTNPTHYAVALSFDFTTMEAPRVLAKGMNLIAKQIREEAQWAGVPIVENPALARSLYRSVEPGQSIPLELYAAIAAILAYLYRKEVKDRMAEEQKAARSAPFSHAR